MERHHMKTLSLIALGLALGATSACAVVEPIETRTWDLADFDSISAGNGVNVTLKQGPYSVSAEGPRDKLARLNVERRGSELRISRDRGVNVNWGMWSQGDMVTVVAPNYTAISAGGGVDIYADDLKLADVSIRSSGGADVSISGACKTLTLEASGGADFNGKDFSCETADVSASGGADASVTATGNATGDGSGGADITFYGVSGTAIGKASSGADIRFNGRPAVVQRDESSGGDVEVSGD